MRTPVRAHTRQQDVADPAMKREEYVDGWSAEETFRQLGGGKFVAMTGAKDFIKDPKTKTLGFRIPRANGITHIKIRLDPNDTYTMEFYHVHGVMNPPKLVKKYEMIYNDQLQDIFTQETGLYTHL
jgi:hypothetical protein